MPDPMDRLVNSMEKLSDRLTETTTALGVLHTDTAVAKEQRARLVASELDHELRIRANEKAVLDAAVAEEQRASLRAGLDKVSAQVAANSDWRKGAVGWVTGVAAVVALAMTLIALYFKAPKNVETRQIMERIQQIEQRSAK